MIITNITGIGDPQIVLHEGTYYCYATVPTSKEGFFVWHSEDLVNWSEAHLCFRACEYWGDYDFWAPEVVYHNGKFIMHYTAHSRELGSRRIGVAVSDSPMGPFADVHGRPMFDFGYNAIDGSVLKTKAGNYLFYSRDCKENFVNGIKTSQTYCVRLNDDLTETVGEAMLMTTPTEPWEMVSMNMEVPHLWNEGPTVLKWNDLYILNFSANYYKTNDYAICVASAEHPLGPWKKSANNPVLSCRSDLFGAGHNAFFRGKDGALYTSFHIQTNPENPSPDRRVAIGKVSFSMVDGEVLQTIE